MAIDPAGVDRSLQKICVKWRGLVATPAMQSREFSPREHCTSLDEPGWSRSCGLGTISVTSNCVTVACSINAEESEPKRTQANVNSSKSRPGYFLFSRVAHSEGRVCECVTDQRSCSISEKAVACGALYKAFGISQNYLTNRQSCLSVRNALKNFLADAWITNDSCPWRGFRIWRTGPVA